MVAELEKLVEAFAHHVQAQTQESFKGDVRTGNKHAEKAFAAFQKLRSHGDAGRDALAVLFTHPNMDVRTAAAALLLRHRTAEAKAVLEEASNGTSPAVELDAITAGTQVAGAPPAARRGCQQPT